jgi:hypothetical protein
MEEIVNQPVRSWYMMETPARTRLHDAKVKTAMLPRSPPIEDAIFDERDTYRQRRRACGG